MAADIPQAGGAQQGVAQGMQGNVPVGVCRQAARVIDGDAGQDELSAVLETMGVIALAYSQHCASK